MSHAFIQIRAMLTPRSFTVLSIGVILDIDKIVIGFIGKR